ncbi:MAG TPA: FAD-dependent oxidoreductase, partial [Candidatus Synoicihabitans sp.]|nr:FAD-dependent oxidoreductase [Candidatus Synoicihabitans sp.]
MTFRLFCAVILALLFTLGGRASESVPREEYDVIVVGGSSGGIGAALGAARMGVRVALIEDTPVLGGMLANGISNIDSYSYQSLSGVFEEFRQRVRAHYEPRFDQDPLFSQRRGPPGHIDGRSFAAHEPREGGRWEPQVADQIFKAMATHHPNLRIYYR